MALCSVLRCSSSMCLWAVWEGVLSDQEGQVQWRLTGRGQTKTGHSINLSCSRFYLWEGSHPLIGVRAVTGGTRQGAPAGLCFTLKNTVADDAEGLYGTPKHRRMAPTIGTARLACRDLIRCAPSSAPA